ncbi:MAG: adenylate/guanylate cyclase domain-containing protein [Candidatus Brocadiales bacterium]
MRVLVVDDNEDSLVIQKTTLEAQGYTVESAANGKQALEMATRSRPDIIISDILMPEMDGFAFCQAVKGDEKLRTVPFVFHTASYISPEDAKLAMALGATDLVVKTGDMKELLKTIEKVLKDDKEGRFHIPSQPSEDKEELERMHKEALIRQLDKKVRELEKGKEVLEETNIQVQATNIKLADSIDKEVRIRKLFERYVPKNVVNEVLQRSDEHLFRGENRRVSILFLDVRQFTQFTEKYDPEDVVAVLNKLFSEVSKTIIHRGGIVDKFIGDGILAVFGAPVLLDDHALCAVLAAIDIKNSLAGFNDWLEDRMGESIVIGIGINSGEVISGNVGSTEKMEYTVVGGPVNMAFRIEGFTKGKPNSIFISKDTHDEVKDKVKAVSLGMKNLKGNTKSTELFEVVGC